LGSEKEERFYVEELYSDVPLIGIRQGFDPDGPKYELYYSTVPLRYDEKYELVVLPGSKLVLDFRKLG